MHMVYCTGSYGTTDEKKTRIQHNIISSKMGGEHNLGPGLQLTSHHNDNFGDQERGQRAELFPMCR
jgi:hypothetical protein